MLAPAFYYENPHRFPEFIRISEYPHWLYIATSRAMYQWNVTDPNNAHDGDRIAELLDSDSDSDTTHEQTKTHKNSFKNSLSKREIWNPPSTNCRCDGERKSSKEERCTKVNFLAWWRMGKWFSYNVQTDIIPLFRKEL